MRSLRGFRLFLVVLLSTSLFVSIISLTPYTVTPPVFASPSITVFPSSAPHGYGRSCLPGVGPFNSANCNPPPSATTPPSSSQAVVQVSGSGFSGTLGTGTHGLGYTCSLFAFGPGTLFDNNPNRTACKITNTGTVIANFSVSSSAPQGSYTLNVTDFAQPYYSSGTTLNTQRSATTTFTVYTNPTITLSTNAGSPGTTVSITGSGFAAGISSNPDQGSCTMNSVTGGTMNITSHVSCFIDSSGNLYSTQFTVPLGAGTGGYQINVTGSHGDYALVGFVVAPFTFTLNPVRGQPGQTVIITGNGATASKGTSCTVTADNPNLIASYSASVVDNIGDVSGSFVVGSTAAGKAGGGANNVTLSCGSGNTGFTGFTVVPAITLNPTAGSGNRTVSVTGSGFRADLTGCQVSNIFNALDPATDNNFAQFATCSLTGTGTISAQFTVNVNAKNVAWNITVTGFVNGKNVTKDLNGFGMAYAFYYKVQAPFILVSPTETAPGYGTLDGTPITVSGGGFPTGSSRSCTLSAISGAAIFATSPAISCTISGSGTVTGSFAVATSATFGNYTILVTDTTSQPFPPTFPSASTPFNVKTSPAPLVCTGSPVMCTVVSGPLPTGSAGTFVTLYDSHSMTASTSPYITDGIGTTLFQPTFDAGFCTISSSPTGLISSPTCFIANNGSLATASFQVAASAASGGYTITITAVHGDFGTAFINVAATGLLMISPGVGYPPVGSLPGTTVTITGSGYSPQDTSCTITTQNVTKPTIVSSPSCSVSSGSLSATFVVASTATFGQWVLNVTGTPGNDRRFVSFIVLPRIVLSPTSGSNGTQVTVTGAGFFYGVGPAPCFSFTSSPFGLVQPNPPQTSTTCTISNVGTVAASFAVGETFGGAVVPQGAYTVTVVGTAPGATVIFDSATAVFVKSTIPLTVNPSSGGPLQFVSVTGSGFNITDTSCLVLATTPFDIRVSAATSSCAITHGSVTAGFQVILTANPGTYNVIVQGLRGGGKYDYGYGAFTVALVTTVTITTTSYSSTSFSSTTQTTLTTTTNIFSTLTTTTFQTTGISTAISNTFTTTTTTGISTSATIVSATTSIFSGTSTTLTTFTTFLTKTFGQIIRPVEQEGPYFDGLGLLAILIVLGPWVLRRLLD